MKTADVATTARRVRRKFGGVVTIVVVIAYVVNLFLYHERVDPYIEKVPALQALPRIVVYVLPLVIFGTSILLYRRRVTRPRNSDMS
jgi:hypothetical protein